MRERFEVLAEQCRLNAAYLRRHGKEDEGQCWDDLAYACSGGLSRSTDELREVPNDR